MVSLLADLDNFELSGTGFGQEVSGLSFLGRSDSGAFDYAGKGLRLDVEDGCLAAFTLALRPDVYLGPARDADVRRFTGRLRINGRESTTDRLTTEGQFTIAWGAPYWRDVDADEILLFFEFPDGEIQVELSLEGEPRVLLVSQEPLMADPEQRRSYGVTRPWPPVA